MAHDSAVLSGGTIKRQGGSVVRERQAGLSLNPGLISFQAQCRAKSNTSVSSVSLPLHKMGIKIEQQHRVDMRIEMICVKLRTVPATRPGHVCCAVILSRLQDYPLCVLGPVKIDAGHDFHRLPCLHRQKGSIHSFKQILSEHLLGAGYSWGHRKTKA